MKWQDCRQNSSCANISMLEAPLVSSLVIFFKLTVALHKVFRILIFHLSSYCYMLTLYGDLIRRIRRAEL